ncbi:PKD domain-containing protein, partial [Archangium sp.]|uniref:PKD domain-containing protein n=1 Tax=Archangium sp. TaxID=1872627 RepID=UPI002ED8154D
MRSEQVIQPRGLLLRGLMVLVCALTACTENAAVPYANGPMETGLVRKSLRDEAPLAHFRGTVDVEHGTLTFESLAPPKDMARWGGKDSRTLRDVVVVQDGKAGSGPVNSVELVTTRTSKDGAECGASDRFCGEVAIRSFYAVPLRNVWVELDAMAPESGFEAYNSSTTVPAGLQNRYGLFSYGDLEAKGGSNTARWGFNLAKGSGRKSFTFTGRVMAELTSSDAPIAEAGPDQHVFNGDTVQLNGTGSSDPQNRSLTYSWTLVSKPAGSNATLAQATTSTPTFDADLGGDYVLSLVVNNGVEDSAPDTLTVNSVFRNTLSVTSRSLLTSDSGTLTVTLGSPALPGGQTVNLASNNSTVASVPASVFVPAGTRTATFTATSGTQSGSATITAFAPDFFDGTSWVHVSNRHMALALPSSLVGVNRDLTGTLTLNHPAPAAGVTVNLSTNANNVATISPASITFAAGQATATFTVTGLAEGQATFSAQAIGYNNATVNVSVTASSIISIPGNTVVAPDQTLTFPVSLSTPAPAGGLTVQLTSSAPGVVSVTPSVVIPAGATTPSTQPTVTGLTLGSATLTATGTGYAPDTRAVDVRLSMNLSPTSISVLVNNTNTLVLSLSAPAPAGGVTVNLRTDNAARATVPATVTFPAGQSQVDVVVTGFTVGTTTLRATGVGLNEATASITVNPAPALSLSSAMVGKDLVTSSNGSLAAPAPAGNLLVTITSADPSKVLLATASGATGTSSITLQVGAGNSSIPTFYIYALDSSGTVQLTATAPGYANGTTPVTLRPSGFHISTGNFSTTALSADTGVTIGTAMLDPTTFANLGSQALRPGVSASVPITSSNATVGVITSSPVAFSPGEYQKSTTFDPIGGGTTTLAITQPAGFTAPSTKQQITATVTAPNITVYDETVGKDLQTSTYVSLGTAAPTGGVAVTVTVADPTKALLSTSATSVGSSSLTFNLATGGSSTPSFYIQALAGSGTVQYTATAPGYTGKTGTITLRPSGVMVSTCVVCGSTINTTTFSSNSNVYAFLGRLNPTT